MSDNEKKALDSEELTEDVILEPEQSESKAVEPKKTDKVAKKVNKKPSIFKRIAKWFRDLKSEAKKVVWPTGKQTFNNTAIVIVAVIVVAIFVALLDSSFGFVRDLIARLV